jgi:hypothetical protein
MTKPDHPNTLRGEQHDLKALFIIGVCLLSPQSLGFIHNIWASSLTGKLLRALVLSEAMETENDVGRLSTGIRTLPNVMLFSKEHSGCK